MTANENDILDKEKMSVCTSSKQAGAFSVSFIIHVLFGLPYLAIWGLQAFHNLDFSFSIYTLGYIFAVFVGMIGYELVQGLTWSLFSQDGLKSMKFEMKWNYLKPFCYYKDPLKVKTYIIGLLMPSVIWGIIPLIWSLVNGSLWLFLFGVFFTFIAGGDYWLAGKLRNDPPDKIIWDHPSEIGCYIYRDNESPFIYS